MHWPSHRGCDLLADPDPSPDCLMPLLPAVPALAAHARVAPALLIIAVAHAFNDLFQAVLPSLYPTLQARFALSYAQLGLITLLFHLIGSICQPLVGWYTDRHPSPKLLPWAMGCMGAGMLLLTNASSFVEFLLVAALVGLGSSIFHPEGSRAARAASGGRLGLAQSVFQLGGNIGSAAAPLLLAILLFIPLGSLAVGLAVLALGVFMLLRKGVVANLQRPVTHTAAPSVLGLMPRGRKARAMLLLILLVISKYVYLACVANFYTFFLIERFTISIPDAQLYLFVFLLAIALGTLLGGLLVDRIGRRRVIALSILGACPFAGLLPHVPLVTAVGLSVLVGVIIASAFAAILLMAQELLPGRIGLVAGGFFGLTFGISGIAAAGLGVLADHWGLISTFEYASCLPLLGLIAWGLPKDDQSESVQ